MQCRNTKNGSENQLGATLAVGPDCSPLGHGP